jgi:hypothetical protein
MYRWNTLSSIALPVFAVLYGAFVMAGFLWMIQLSPTVCWMYLCWPTRIFPQFPPIVRHLIVAGKFAVAVFVQFGLVMVIAGVGGHLVPEKQYAFLFAALFLLTTGFFIVTGWFLRKFTAQGSEAPHLGVWPVVAVMLLNLAISFYFPVFYPQLNDSIPTGLLRGLGATFGFAFILAMGYLILKKDFLRVRMISSITTLAVVLLIPFAINRAEYFSTVFLAGSPFFRESGAELVIFLCVLLIAPSVHHLLHEVLLRISLPRLRRIEHEVEHALEAIVDARDDQARVHLVSELFKDVQVTRYLFLSRGAEALFYVDINRLDRAVPPSLELSPPLRKFLGKHHHFIDLESLAFEWTFFFHQFELNRLRETTGCRYLLPLSVGESLRGLLLLADGPGTAVIANPAVSTTISNLGLGTALSRRRG